MVEDCRALCRSEQTPSGAGKIGISFSRGVRWLVVFDAVDRGHADTAGLCAVMGQDRYT